MSNKGGAITLFCGPAGHALFYGPAAIALFRGSAAIALFYGPAVIAPLCGPAAIILPCRHAAGSLPLLTPAAGSAAQGGVRDPQAAAREAQLDCLVGAYEFAVANCKLPAAHCREHHEVHAGVRACVHVCVCLPNRFAAALTLICVVPL